MIDRGRVTEGRPRGKRMVAAARVAQIVQQSRTLMAQDGYAALSLRSVAERCGIRLATLQHHFPTKASLLESIIEDVLNEYDLGVGAMAADNGAEPRRHLRALFAFFLEQNEREETAGFFIALWALAHHDEAARAGLARLYEIGGRIIADLIRRVHADMSVEEASRRALMCLAASDGLLLTVGYGKTSPLPIGPDHQERFLDLLMLLVEGHRDG